MSYIQPTNITEKFCFKCKTTKPFSAFGKDKGRKYGLTASCKQCRNKRNLEYFTKHPEVRAMHNARNKEKRKLYYSDPIRKLKYKNKDLLYSYGITLEQYEAMLKSQNSVCMICKKEEVHRNNQNTGVSRLSVDHCHSTGKIRGILCTKCNTGLGSFKDNIELLTKAIQYLKGELK